MSEFFQPLDPAGAPDPVTPADSPGDAAGYAMVTPGGRGTAPYDIAADNGEGAITAAFDAANSLAGPGGPRQAATEKLLYSPQGFTGEPDESWANNAQASSVLETPIQGMGDYPGTMQDGLQTYGC